jgi:hypothetical protein
MIYYCCLVYLGLFLIYIKYLKLLTIARGILATIAASAGQNGKFSKVGASAGQNGKFSKVATVFVYLLSNFRFDNNLCITASFFSQSYLFLPSVFPCIRPLYNDPLSNATNDHVLWVKILHITTIRRLTNIDRNICWEPVLHNSIIFKITIIYL